MLKIVNGILMNIHVLSKYLHIHILYLYYYLSILQLIKMNMQLMNFNILQMKLLETYKVHLKI